VYLAFESVYLAFKSANRGFERQEPRFDAE